MRSFALLWMTKGCAMDDGDNGLGDKGKIIDFLDVILRFALDDKRVALWMTRGGGQEY